MNSRPIKINFLNAAQAGSTLFEKLTHTQANRDNVSPAQYGQALYADSDEPFLSYSLQIWNWSFKPGSVRNQIALNQHVLHNTKIGMFIFDAAEEENFKKVQEINKTIDDNKILTVTYGEKPPIKMLVMQTSNPNDFSPIGAEAKQYASDHDMVFYAVDVNNDASIQNLMKNMVGEISKREVNKYLNKKETQKYITDHLANLDKFLKKELARENSSGKENLSGFKLKEFKELHKKVDYLITEYDLVKRNKENDKLESIQKDLDRYLQDAKTIAKKHRQDHVTSPFTWFFKLNMFRKPKSYTDYKEFFDQDDHPNPKNKKRIK